MEEKGLVTPAYTAPDSGRRYYDNHNVARVLQIEKFKAMGLGAEAIAAYFAAAATPRSCWRRWRRGYTTCSAAWRSCGCGRAARRACPCS